MNAVNCMPTVAVPLSFRISQSVCWVSKHFPGLINVSLLANYCNEPSCSENVIMHPTAMTV